MLFAGWEVRIVKNCDWKTAPEPALLKFGVTVIHFSNRPSAGKKNN